MTRRGRPSSTETRNGTRVNAATAVESSSKLRRRAFALRSVSNVSVRLGIGQSRPDRSAKGVLMERFDIDAVAAFEILKELSQDTNTPIRDLAVRVIDI